MRSKFSRQFYRQDTKTVAQALLGQVLVYQPAKGKHLSARIIEVEAYLGEKDAACHTYNGRRTPRTETMYLDGGHSYVYFIYGMHFCFNVVTRSVNQPEAVLIRAVEPLDGLKWMEENRKVNNPKNLCNGPAKLCQAFQIDRTCNGLDLISGPLLIEPGESVPKSKIGSAPRVGVDYAGKDKYLKLRYFIRNHPLLSLPKPIE